MGERVNHQRRADGLGGGAAKALQDPTCHEHPHIDRQARQQRADHECRQPGHEEPAAPQRVRGAAKGQEQAGDDQQIRQHNPLQGVELASNSTARVGSARLTALESSVAMNTLLETTANVVHLRERGIQFKARRVSAERTRKLDQRAGESFRVRGG